MVIRIMILIIVPTQMVLANENDSHVFVFEAELSGNEELVCSKTGIAAALPETAVSNA